MTDSCCICLLVRDQRTYCTYITLTLIMVQTPEGGWGCLNCDHTAELSAAASSITVNTAPEPWQASPEPSFPKQLYWATLRGSKSPKKFGWRCSRRCQARDHCSQQRVRCKGSVGRFWPVASTKCKFFLKFVWYWSCVVVQWHHRDVRFIWKL